MDRLGKVDCGDGASRCHAFDGHFLRTCSCAPQLLRHGSLLHRTAEVILGASQYSSTAYTTRILEIYITIIHF
jgi:hypothetical protein